MSSRISVLTNTGRYVGLYVLDCANCGVIFAVHDEYNDRRRDDGRGFHCPNGHSLSYTETAEDRAKKEAERLRARLVAEMDQRQAAEDDAAAARASEVRLRWRVGNGVCPCCSRTFPGLAAHVATKHPELGPDAARCRLVLSERCLGELDYATVTADRIDQGGTYARHNVQPACHSCQRLQGGHANVRLMGPIIEAYRAVREQWEIRFDLETNHTYYPGIIEIERRRERRGGRREVTDWLEENPPPTWREFLVEWAASRREYEAAS